jgi:amino-acid N-acetyltransferase
MLITKAGNYRENVIQLLTAVKLPVEDLPLSLENFYVVVDNSNEVIGVAGLEIYGDYGLLRSLAILPEHRDQGIAGQLLERVENLALLNNLKAIYLLTETAPEYFSRKGYARITRADVPEGVQASSEFSHVCPVSAIVMKKELI